MAPFAAASVRARSATHALSAVAVRQRRRLARRRPRDSRGPCAACGAGARARAGEMQPLATPLLLRGVVVKGFGRGSRELGIPTANLDTAALEAAGALAGVAAGIYAGWATVRAQAPDAAGAEAGAERTTVHKMVMSIGWNPFYKNERKTVEPHLLHVFPADFYGAELRLAVTGYLRPEASFPSLDALIAAIHGDIEAARRELHAPPPAGSPAYAFLVEDGEGGGGGGGGGGAAPA